MNLWALKEAGICSGVASLLIGDISEHRLHSYINIGHIMTVGNFIICDHMTFQRLRDTPTSPHLSIHLPLTTIGP